MNRCSIRRCLLLIAGLVMGVLTTGARGQPCPPAWVPGEGIVGVDGPVYASAVFDDGSGPSLFVGGAFGVAGSVRVHGIARWDGQTWHAVGALNELPEGAAVGALTVWNGTLVASVSWIIQGKPVAAISRWDGVSWTSLPTGAGTSVTSMTTFNGDLIVAGHVFTAGGQNLGLLARWDGLAWSTVGPGLLISRINAVFPYAGSLYVGGIVFLPGGSPQHYIARFDGASWSIPGGGLKGEVFAFAEYGGELIATGRFRSYGASPISCIARWDGASWKPLGDGFDTGGNGDGGLALAVFNDDLFVGGDMEFGYRPPGCGSDLPYGVARWNGSCWQRVGGLLFSTAYTLAAFEGTLFVGSSAWEFAGNLGFWDGVSWSIAVTPDTGPVSAITSLDGSLVIGGYFYTVEGAPARYIAVRQNGRWEPLGTGTASPVHSFATYRGQLVASGSFDYRTTYSKSGGETHIWNGTEWLPLVSGLQQGASADALLAVGDELIGAGWFLFDDSSESSVARWDGQVWHPMGANAEDFVVALAHFEDNVLGAGAFAGLGNCVARWDGQSWLRVGNSLPGYPTSIAVHGGRLYAAGRGFICRLDNGIWTKVGTANPKAKCLLHEHAGSLFAASWSLFSGGPPYTNIAWLDGTDWVPVGGGLNIDTGNYGYGLDTGAFIGALASDGPDLLFGGNFTRAGDTVTAYLARFAASNAADVNLDGFLDPLDYNLFINLFEARDLGADINRDGYLDPLDYNGFINAFEAGC